MTRVHVFIAGEVQGVFFRAHTTRKAQSLGLSGWVKNAPDGRVEAVFEGEEKAINKMISWCHQGPPASRVESVEVFKEKPEELEGFEIRY